MIRNYLLATLSFLVVSSASAAPATATVSVDCNKGQKINNALNHPAVELTIEISGICVEDVEITRTHVTLRGSDPTMDGIMSDPAGLKRQALTVRNASFVRVENLKLTGGANGIGINDSFGVTLINCRLMDNEFAGAVVGTGSGSVFIANTVVAAPTPPAGARLRRGIWITNGSNVACNDCEITGYRGAFLVTVGSSLTVNRGTFTGTRDSLDIFDNSAVYMDGSTIDGRVRVETKSIAQLFNTVQTGAPTPNRSRRGSSLIAEGGTTLIGDAWIGDFANMSILDSSSTTGELDCFEGGDAYCANPVTQTAGSNCGQCPNPP